MASTATIIATILVAVGVVEKRVSSSALTCSPAGALPSRSLKTPTIWGRTSPSTFFVASAAPDPVIAAVVRSDVDDTVIVHSLPRSSVSGVEISERSRRITSRRAGADSVAAVVFATRP